MKKFLTTLFCLTLLTGAMSAANGLSRKTVVERLDSCEAILQEVQSNIRNAIPADVLHRAKAIVIVNQFQASFIFGIKDGYATALVRRPNGKWSVPAFYRAGELSLGLQIGGKSINAVYVIMDDATSRLLLKNRMNLGAEAKAVAGIRTAESDSMGANLRAQANVLVYSSAEGLFAGAAIKTAYLSPHAEANQMFYNSTTRVPELLFSDWVTPPEEARFLMNYVTRLTQ
jgi:SH3 domain-containing YSC84-like protein 1